MPTRITKAKVEFPEVTTTTSTPSQPMTTHWSETEPGPNLTRCDCMCKCPTSNCSCDCLCPYRDNRKESIFSTLSPDTCEPGYTKLCPKDGTYCPASSTTLCPVRDEEEEEEEEVEEVEESTPELNRGLD